jgi:uncharacterized cupin superfamily protein
MHLPIVLADAPLVNKSSAMAVYLDVGSRNPHNLTTCSDIGAKAAIQGVNASVCVYAAQNLGSHVFR